MVLNLRKNQEAFFKKTVPRARLHALCFWYDLRCSE